MKLHFLKEDALAALKGNIEANLHHYQSPSNEWIYDYFQGENPFGEFKMEVPDFQLVYDPNLEPSINDIMNAKILHSALIDLSDTQATDERFWAGLCHCDFWNYCRTRWHYDFDCKKLTKEQIGNRYFFHLYKKRAIQLNTIAKLWWTARLFYDTTRKDPYELLKYFESDYAIKSLVILSNNYISNPSVSHGLIEALIEMERQGLILPGRKQEVFYEATRYLNVLGGTHILDYFTSDEIKARVITHLRSLKGASYRRLTTEEQKEANTKTDSFSNDNLEIKADQIIVDDQISIERFGEAASFLERKNNSNALRENEGDALNPNTPIISEISQFGKPDEVISDDGVVTKGDDSQLRIVLPKTDLLLELQKDGFEYIDHRRESGLIWVIYDPEKVSRFSSLKNIFSFESTLERRGAKATDNRPAWCISRQNEVSNEN